MTFPKFVVTAIVLTGVIALGACKDHYERPGGFHDLGEVKDLLYSEHFVQDRGFLVKRDAEGWSALSARCSNDGCELTYRDESLRCMCCGSEFDHDGHVMHGPAKYPLPYYTLVYTDNHLYVDTNEEVKESYRFTTPEIEQAIAQLRERIKREGIRPGAKVPEILLGTGDNEPGEMFKEKTDAVSTVSQPATGTAASSSAASSSGGKPY